MPKAQLFITCLGDQFYTATLQNMVAVLERLGVELEFPTEQTCCGQPLYNNGFTDKARSLARKWVNSFSRRDTPVIVPSGSCAGMIKHHFLEMFPEGSPEYTQTRDLAARTYEFTDYLVHQLGVVDVGACFPHRVTYHPSCHYQRELGLKEEARSLLRAVKGLDLLPLEDEDTCCGFGGAFSVTFPEVSRTMMQDKVRNIMASKAEVVVMCEPGCLMNIAGGLHKAGSPVRAMHIIDILAAREALG